MIKASELRIGNYLYFLYKKENRGKDVFKRIAPITAEQIVIIDKHEDPGDFFEAILLTPTILESCGFEKESADFRKGNFKIFSGHHEWMFLYTAIHCKEDDLIFKYVHELQNLYFALYRKELEINLIAEKSYV